MHVDISWVNPIGSRINSTSARRTLLCTWCARGSMPPVARRYSLCTNVCVCYLPPPTVSQEAGDYPSALTCVSGLTLTYKLTTLRLIVCGGLS